MSSLDKELAQTELLRDVSEPVLRQLMAQSTPMELAPGAVLLAPERENQHVYLLLSGVLTIHFGTQDSPPIHRLTPGVSVGEISIIDDAPPSAYVIAHEASRVFPIHRDLIHKLVSDINPMARNLLRMLARAMKANTQLIVKDRLQIWELTDQVHVDGLTGLYNRRWLDNALPRLIAQVNSARQTLCILMIDVDRFKAYNDTQGHLGGDQALVAVGKVLKNTVRPYDFATRYGGEEFLVLLPNTPQLEAIEIAERIRAAAEKKSITSTDGQPLPGITISVGLAISTPDATVSALIGAADAQLYCAKKQGRNCVRFESAPQT